MRIGGSERRLEVHYGTIFAALIFSLGAACGLSGEALAAASVPASVLTDFRSAAALARQDEARIEHVSAATRDPLLAARMREEGRRQSATTFGYVVNTAIAGNPGAAQAIVSAAITEAPELREEIIQAAITAFPGFRDQIQEARPGRFQSQEPETALPPTEVASPLLPAPYIQAPTEYVHPPAAETRDNVIWDPWEPVNRPLFAVYQFLDDFLVRPIAQGYGWIVPGPIKKGVRNAFRNLDSPIVFANDLLQLQPGDAAVTLGRFVINTTVGGLGFFDVAERGGLPGHPADFDQTLHFYHVPSGPYMILPILGPGTVRHNLGRVVDAAADPVNWSGDVDNSIKIGRTIGNAIATRENLIEPLDTLRKDSLDWYATFRATYNQDRNVVLRKGATAPTTQQNDLFDEAQ